MKRVLGLVALSLCYVVTVLGQQSPAAFFGFERGDHFTPHAGMVAYYEKLAADKPDQVRIERMGLTAEFKPQILVVLSSKANMTNIEAIRQANLKRSRGEKVVEYEGVTFVWLGMSVHGNEPAGSEAGPQVAYDLLTDPAYSKWLDHAVVLIDASQNPDGYNRYTSWYNEVGHSQPDVERSGREHIEPWPQGRVNHYYFDLNRDWAWQTQVESQNRIASYRRWMPHVVADIHEMGVNEPYYFPPAAQPYHELISPWQSSFQVTIGKNHASHFDENGWLYYTREVFDLFYPSYGDTWPTYNGAVGMTYEQGGIGGGLAVKLRSGDTLTLRDRVEHHRMASLSTVEVSANNAPELVKEFYNFGYLNTHAPAGRYNAFVIRPNAASSDEFTEILDRNGIQYSFVEDNVSGLSGLDYWTRKSSNFTAQINDIVVFSKQPASVIAQALLEPDPKLVDSMTYDITAWSLPHAFGYEAWAVSGSTASLKTLAEPIAEKTLGQNIDKAYAYAIMPGSMSQGRALAALRVAGIRAVSSQIETQFSYTKCPPGTVFVLRGENRHLGADFDKAVIKILTQEKAAYTTIESGYSVKGPDLGSDWMQPVRDPKVAVAFGPEVDHNAYGAVWFYLEKELHQPFRAVAAADLGTADLSSFNTLILTDQDNGYEIDSAAAAHIKAWVQGGGRLVLLGSAIRPFVGQDGFDIKVKKAEDPKSDETHFHHPHFCDAYRNSQSTNVPGSVLIAKMDSSHPIISGINRYATLKTSARTYQFSADLEQPLWLDAEPIMYGFVGSKVKGSLGETPVLTIQSMGSGQVVHMTDNPLFRCFWYQGKVLMNNVLYK
jgi:Zinc carboxypeptidase